MAERKYKEKLHSMFMRQSSCSVLIEDKMEISAKIKIGLLPGINPEKTRLLEEKINAYLCSFLCILQ